MPVVMRFPIADGSSHGHDPIRRPSVPPEWTPPPAPEPPTPPAHPAQPSRPPPLPMILRPDIGGEDIVGLLLRERIITLAGDLDEHAVEIAASKLLLLNDRSQDTVTVHMSCRGDDPEAAIALISTIDLLGCPVTTVAAGSIEAYAVAIYAVGDRRVSHPHATFVMRQPRVALCGDAEQLRTAAEQHQRIFDLICQYIAGATAQTSESIADDLRRGRLVTADEAQAWGLVHELTSQQ